MICKVDDLRMVRSVSYAMRDMARIEPYIEEAELLDVMPVISPPLYHLLDETNPPLPGGYIYIAVENGSKIVAVSEDQLVAVNTEPSPTGETVIRDKHGNRIGTSDNKYVVDGSRLPVGRILIKDRDGMYLMTNDGSYITDGSSVPPPPPPPPEPDLWYEDILYPFYYDGNKKYHNGLKRAIAYFAYARAIVQANVSLTALGTVSRLSEFSTPVSSSSLKLAENEARKIAAVILTDVIKYIDWEYCQSRDDRFVRDPQMKVKTVGFYSIGD